MKNRQAHVQELLNDTVIPVLSRSLCDNSCVHATQDALRLQSCVLWHQLQLLDVVKHLPSCVQFLTETEVCKMVLPGLRVICDEQGRVVQLTAMAEVMPRQGSGGRGCVASWTGQLSPLLALLTHLQEIDFSAPTRYLRLNRTAMPLSADLVGACQGLEWTGSNITGTIPQEWGQMNLTLVDLSGNQLLTGEVPAGWVESVETVRAASTGLHMDTECDIDCRSQEFNVAQQERCAIWYQLSRLESRDWLPPCTAYIKKGRDICSRRWEQTLDLTCDLEGRITQLKAWPIFKSSLGLRMFPFVNEFSGGNCTAFYSGSLAPELSVLAFLQKMFWYTPTFDIYVKGNNTLIDKTVINCDAVEWTGGGITGEAPQEWDLLKHLDFLEVSGNRGLRGDIPEAFLHMDHDIGKAVYICDTQMRLPSLKPYKQDRMCKLGQRSNGSLYIYKKGQGYYLGMNMDKQMFTSGQIVGPWVDPSVPKDQISYCGRRGAIHQVLAVWLLFLVFLVVTAVVRTMVWRRQQQHTTRNNNNNTGTSTCLQHMVSWLRSLLDRFQTPLFAFVTMYDIAADVLLAYSMYPSWTTWLIIAGTMLPELICSWAVTMQGVPQLKQRLPACPTYALATLLFIVTAGLLPGIVVYLVVEKLLGWKKRRRGLLDCYLGLDVHRLAALLHGVTACTEDVVTNIFTSLGFVLMAKAPWTANKSNIYFALWTFWQSMVTSMCHMLTAWWVGWGHWLDSRNFQWVKDAFCQLHEPVSGPSDKDDSSELGKLERMISGEGGAVEMSRGPPPEKIGKDVEELEAAGPPMMCISRSNPIRDIYRPSYVDLLTSPGT